MELVLVSESGRKKDKAESKVTIGKRYAMPSHKKTQAKLDRADKRKKTAANKTVKSVALEKERNRYRDQIKAIREKHKSQMTAEIDKAKSQHMKKVEAIRGKPATNAKPKPKPSPTSVLDAVKK